MQRPQYDDQSRHAKQPPSGVISAQGTGHLSLTPSHAPTPAAVGATAQARQGTATKDEAFAKLVDLMKTDLRYDSSLPLLDRVRGRAEPP
jgi:hypothetical protein